MTPPLRNRRALAALFAASGYARGAEIGVGDGVHARALLDAIPGLFLYCVDPWDDGGGNRRGESSYQATLAALEPYRGQVDIVRMTSAEALAEWTAGPLDFVFIDGAHDYASVARDIAGWAPKVRPGGIVSGHDYYTLKASKVGGVVNAVDDYARARRIDLQVTSWDRANPAQDERQPCWWFLA
ncbi:MAG: class I SAM-dependent methyltransferase [Pseudomonadota bacterium]